MKVSYLLVALLIPVVIGLITLADQGQSVEELDPAVMQRVEPVSGAMAPCTMTRTNGTGAYWSSGFVDGERVVALYDPISCGQATTYPFDIRSIDFTLFAPDGYQWTIGMDLVVYQAVSGQDPTCPIPGSELCRQPLAIDSANFHYPNVGTANFSDPCCINGPVFVGLEYNDQGLGSFPSVMWDGQVVDTCTTYFYYAGVWYEQYDQFGNPAPGYPLFWVNGETNAATCGACDWAVGDPHKMHYPQLPDEAGWDVNATKPMILAEDWRCTETGWIKDFHFWGSWKGGVEGIVDTFWLSIHEDVPAGVDRPYSHPGATLWELPVTVFDATPVDPPTAEGWYDPATKEIIPDDHQAYFQYNICLPENDWFWQEAGTIYWLNISAVIEDPVNTHWGWKSTQDHFNDDAVWAMWGNLDWVDIWEPAEPILSQFWVAFGPDGTLIPLQSGGIEPYGQGWYEYESGWWNIWFYDHPFTYERRKSIHMEFNLYPYDGSVPSYTVVAVNWSTDVWSLEGNPPTEPRVPPLPPTDEELFIGRDTVLVGENLDGFYVFDYVIPDYNPEWVSVDVMGYNFVIQEGTGQLFHSCEGSLDLSFVVTGEAPADPEACCLPDGSCIAATPADCQNQGGTPQGVGTVCLGDSDGNGIDDLCEVPEACCLPDGSCIDALPSVCAAQGGAPQGTGTQCSAAPQVCCLPDGSCLMLDPLCCDDLGGTPSPTGALTCLGDNNQNGVDDACEDEQPDTCEYYKPPYEDYAPGGMPDFDQKHPLWVNSQTGQFTFDGPVALANCLWWFDSKFEPLPLDPRPFYPGPGNPPLNDNYWLLPSFDASGIWDDHDTNNVEPFVVVLANALQTDQFFPGTDINLYHVGVVSYLQSLNLHNHYIVEMFSGDLVPYDFIRDEILRSQDVILLLGFYEQPPTGGCYRIGGHYVTVAGTCFEDSAVCISDPWLDANEGEPPTGSAHLPGVHSDAAKVSGPHGSMHHDKYFVAGPGSVSCVTRPYPILQNYPMGPSEVVNFLGVNPGFDPSQAYSGGPIYTAIEAFIKICPCCVGSTGNVDCDPTDKVDISDLTTLVNHLFVTFQPLCCAPEANTNGDIDYQVDVSDLTKLVNHLFVTFEPLSPCP